MPSRSVFRWVGILPSAIQAGIRRYPNAGQRIDSKGRRARDDSWASCPDNRAHDGNRAAAQPVRCRVRKQKLQIGFIVALVVLALLSGFVARPHFADTKTWDSTIEVIDQKKGNVLALTTSCVALSAGITALPGDTGTPVAEQLAQLSGNLGIVLAVLYLEKYLLTILWSVGLGILIPFALVALCGVAWHSRTLEHERRPTPRGDSRAGGLHDRNGLGACKRMGVAKGRRNVSSEHRGGRAKGGRRCECGR